MPINYNQHRIIIGSYTKIYSKFKTKISKGSKITNNKFYKLYKGIKSVSLFLLMYILLTGILSIMTNPITSPQNTPMYYKTNVYNVNSHIYFCFNISSYICNYSHNHCLYLKDNAKSNLNLHKTIQIIRNASDM